MEMLETVLMWVGIIVTFCTTMVVALEKIAEVTPTTKDDEYVATAKKWLGYVSAFLDNFNVYTTKDKKAG